MGAKTPVELEFERAAAELKITEEAYAELQRDKAKNQAIAREAIGAELEEERREIGFSARLLVQATLPHSKPAPGVTEFERRNGYVTVTITARKRFGLPYGIYPRLLMAWLTTEAVRTKSPELDLGDSLTAFMRKIDLTKGGGPQTRLLQHMQRLFTSTLAATYQRQGEWVDVGFRPIVGARIFWDPKRPDQISLWRSNIKLSQDFYDELINHPVPIDLDTLHILAKARSPLAIDIYQWLTYRMSYLREPTTIPWPGLQLQFGCDYGRARAFKEKFVRHLKRVVDAYPDAKVKPTKPGLKLWPSSTHVPKRMGTGLA